jgi:hypothetical protein
LRDRDEALAAACIGASENGSLAADLLDLTNPRHDFVALAQPLAE